MNRMKPEVTALCRAFFFLALILALASCSSAPDYPAFKASIRNLNFTSLADGTYEGEASLFPVSVRVRVTVAAGIVSDIRLLKHSNGKGKPGEAVIDAVKQAQSLQVDAVSGATHSSLTILKAIDAALTEENRK